MSKLITSYIDDLEVPILQKFVFVLLRSETHIVFLRNDVIREFQEFLIREGIEDNLHSLWHFLRKIQEIVRWEDRLILVYRRRKANCRIYSYTGKDDTLEELNKSDFLEIKADLVHPGMPVNQSTMKINLAPFYDYGPTLKDPQTIGNGIKHLNRYMSARLANQPDKWNEELYKFLKVHHLHGVQLLLDGGIIRDSKELEAGLEDALDFLDRCDCDDDPERLKAKLRSLGFLDGWGNSQERLMETFHLLQDILEQPGEETQEEFLSRVPMVSKVTMISPHGWFGQDNVLGRPDTGGQVVYILDQARALEKFLAQDLELSGLGIEPKILIVTRLIPENEGTTSDQRLEKVRGTNNVWILRVPFVDKQGNVVPHWISRFSIWPFLDRFAVDAEREIRSELDGRPDLIIGNYSDGNLVATQLSKNMGVIQCNIAHALEKSKYLFSDLYWQDFEEEYHFSVQFMADLIAMNSANFIITSTSQEIIGTERSIGQYESYQFFTMPGLMDVISGINLYHPRFNVIPPGVNESVYFPYTAEDRRHPAQYTNELAEMLFYSEDPHSFGYLENPDLPPIFSIARLDRIKNLTGLAEAFGKSAELREQANLIIIASVLDPEKSKDAEEAAEIRKMYEVIERYGLKGSFRWIGRMLSSQDAGEVYRIMADRRGIFVQPALFEAFGLTILEAMHSGLPVFATQFGGPQEIIVHRKSGFLINPTLHEDMVERISHFLEACREDPEHWVQISKAGLERARKHFTWDLHCRNLTRLTKVYGFWRYSRSEEAKSRMTQYCHLLYHLFFLDRAKHI